MTGPAARVLVVDDDEAIGRSLDRGLSRRGFAVTVVTTGAAALEARPGHDAMVLDVALPDIGGAEICRRLRAGGDGVPVLMLSALDDTADRIAGLQAGADDYVVKPFALDEVALRLTALLRRAGRHPDPTVLEIGGLVLDPPTRRVTVDGADVSLTGREFALLEVLARNAGIVLSRDQLLDRVWGYEFEVRTDVVDTFVSYLRRKLEAGGRPRTLRTVRGVGFVLDPGPP